MRNTRKYNSLLSQLERSRDGVIENYAGYVSTSVGVGDKMKSHSFA